jgi:hypothetical protein
LSARAAAAAPSDSTGDLAELRARLETLQQQLEQLGAARDSLPREDWYGEQRDPVLRGVERHGLSYRAAFADLRGAAATADPEQRARAIHTLIDRYPGTYLSLVGTLVLAEDAMRDGRAADALALIDDAQESVPAETASNLSVRLQVDLVKGVALAQAGRGEQARALLERAAASTALGPDADRHRARATQALLALESEAATDRSE